jgi:hypothetical protein
MVLTLTTRWAAACRLDWPSATSPATASSAEVSRCCASKRSCAGLRPQADSSRSARTRRSRAEIGRRLVCRPQALGRGGALAGTTQTGAEVGLDERAGERHRQRLGLFESPLEQFARFLLAAGGCLHDPRSRNARPEAERSPSRLT